MPDILDANGLQVKTAAEITADLQNSFRQIYGENINLDQNSPDGQLIGILTQAAVDIRELAARVNAGFDPDQAQGVVLDQRVTINGIARQGGTYTVQPISVTVDRTVALQGLDADYNNPLGTGFTVQDSSGNQFILIDTVGLNAGTTSLNFRAKTVGDVNVPINTIINPVTIVLGVTAINNPSAATSVGQNEETDAQLRVRRQRSVALSSNGYLNGLLGTVLNLEGVTKAALYENVGNETDANGIPAHGIWLVADGGANSDIANAIYTRKSYGSNMKGGVSVDILTANNTVFTAKFDRPSAANLYLDFTIQRTRPGATFNLTSIKTFIVENLAYGIGDYAETSNVTEQAIKAIAAQGGGGVPVLVSVSDDGVTLTDFLAAPTLASVWTLDTARISITVV